MPKEAAATQPKESKSERFHRLAPARVVKAVKAIRSIGKLAGSNYEYTEAEATQILKALASEVQKLQRSFEGTTAEEVGFSFDNGADAS